MIAFLQFLVALVIATHRVTGAGMPADPPQWTEIAFELAAFGLVWSSIGVVYAHRVRRDSEAAIGRFLVVMDAGRISALATFWLIAQQGLAKEWPAALGIANWVLVPHMLRLAPFAVLLSLLRIGLHPVGARLELEPPSVAQTLALEFRQALLPLGPLLPLLIVWDVVFLADPDSWMGAVRAVVIALPVAQALLSLTMLLIAIMGMPFLLRFAWKARPMPPGALRQRLDDYADRVGLRASDVLVWPTGPGVLNAAVVGAFPRFRYVFITDGLLAALGPDEVEAVFAHEAGHARRGHVPLFFGFTTVLVLSSLLPDALGIPALDFWVGLDPLLRSLLMVLVWIGVVFGWISRRFEQEADVYGLDTIPFEPVSDGSPREPSEHPFARALERISEEAGGIRELTGWRHFSIADRVAFVESYLNDAATRARYRRSIRTLRGMLIAFIGGFGVLAGARLPAEVAAAPAIWRSARDPSAAMLQALQNALRPLPGPVRARALLSAALAADRAGRPETGLRWLRTATALSPGDAYVLAAYARALSAADRPHGAAVAWRDLLLVEGAPETLLEQAAAALAKLPEPSE